MPEEDARIFHDYFEIYKKYRGRIMTEDDWALMWREISACAELHRFRDNPLAFHLGAAVADALGDMYRGGKKPALADFFGRADLNGA